MRIGIDCRVFGPSWASIGRYTEGLVHYLSAHDEENEYVLFMNEPQFSEFKTQNSRIKKVLANAETFSLSEQTSFLPKLYRERLDCMHFMGYRAPIFYFRPSVVTIHGLLPFFYPTKKMTNSVYRGLYRWMLRSVTKRAKKVIAVSRHVGRDLGEMANVPEEKIELVFPGIMEKKDIRISEEDRKKYLLQQGIQNPYILFVGNILEHKNLSRFIYAFSDIAEENTEIDMVIAGKEDSMYHEVRQAVIEQGLQKRVHMLGFVEEEKLPLLYDGALAVFSPSLYEGFEFFLLESMSRGVPIICSSVPGHSEVVGDEGAVFFRPLSIKHMQETIQKIISDAALREKLIVCWRKRIEEFDWQKTGAEIRRIYEESAAPKHRTNKGLSITQ